MNPRIAVALSLFPLFATVHPMPMQAAAAVASTMTRTLEAHLAELTPRFKEPSADPAFVMPVGAGDFSAMLRYDDAWEIHLSKTDFLGIDKIKYHIPTNVDSPGHVRLSFGIPRDAVQSFEQRMDFMRGSVVLEIKTADGKLKAEAFGLMGRNTLLIAVEDGRRTPRSSATYSIWRPETKLRTEAGQIVASEVHDYLENGKPPANPERVNPKDRMYHLGCGTAIAFAEENNLLPATGEFGGQGADHSVTLQQDPSVARYWLVITSACTYDGKPDAAAASLLDFAVKSDKISLLQEHLSWWKQFWQASSIDLYGKDADTLMRLWYTGHYSYASVAGGKTLPKFNGGPGLIQRDERSWGWGYWWQNTREQIWPMFAANRLNYVHDALQFYDGTFMECKTSTAIQGKLGIRMDEAVTPRKTDSPVPEKQISKFDSAALEKAMADLTMENKKSYYNVRSLAQSTELTQMMYDYVAYTGDSDFLMKSVAPWLKETTLFWMSYLRKGEDGLYHSMVTDAAEMWWKIKDSSIDLSACRYCFWHVLNDGSTFGYEPEFIAAVTDRADHLAPLPVGSWTHKNLKPGEVVEGLPPGAKATTLIDRTANCYAPAGDLYDDRVSHNVENPELYLVYPFAMVDANSEKSDFDRAVNTFRRRRMPNHSGWSQCPVEAVRLRLDDAVDVIMDHVDRHQKYPYGEWNSPAGKLKGSSLAVTDTPYFDAMGVNLTAVQEALLQSHQLTTPEKTDLLGGGPIVLVPAVRNDWSGKFKLRARGGFNVTVEFEPGKKVTRATVECERGGKLRLANPFGVCDVIRAGKTAKNADPMIILQTQPGEYIDFIWKPIPANSK